MNVQLREVAIARSGDKGDTANVGVIAMTAEVYTALVQQLTADDVKQYFSSVCAGPVERFELPNLKALNFLYPGTAASESSRSRDESRCARPGSGRRGPLYS